MFKRRVQNVHDLVLQCLRQQGLETPLLQKRLVDAWPQVAGEMVARYTVATGIRNQTLYVKVSRPALRADLMMRRTEFVGRLNEAVGSQIIYDVRFC